MKSSNEKGFSLIEWQIYFLLLIMASILLFHSFFIIQKFLIKQNKKLQAITELHTAYDLCKRDILTADYNVKNWIKSEVHSFLYKKNNKYIGWRFNKKTKKLYRTSGVYDANNQNWKKKKVSLIAEDITDFTCIYTIKNEKINFITLSIVNDVNSIYQKCYLKNKVIKI